MRETLPFYMRLVIVVVFLIVSTSFLISQTSTFLLDKKLSPITGARNLGSIHRFVVLTEESVLKPTFFDETQFHTKIAGIAYRLGKSVLVDNVVDHYAYLIQHDYFGHGWRGREFEFKEVKYRLAPPPPYGDGHGNMTWELPTGKVLTSDEHIAFMIGGVEASATLAHAMRLRWLRNGRIHHREARLYLQSSTDLTTYTLFSKWGFSGPRSNDVASYISAVNARGSQISSSQITLEDISFQMIINAADPFLYYSLWTVLKCYIWSGETEFEFPMISIGGQKYLPSFRIELTPFGTEVYIENFVITSSHLMNFYIRHKIQGNYEFWGGGFDGMPLYQNDKINVLAGLAFWKQPPLFMNAQPGTREGMAGTSDSRFGGKVTLVTRAKLPFGSASIHLVSHVGFKSAGFVQGEPLHEGMIARVGVEF